MPDKPTHRRVKSPKVHGRYLAEYMNASERAKRTMIRGCKFPPIAKILQHHLAKAFISDFMQAALPDPAPLLQEAERLRSMMVDTDFDRILLDVNADFLSAFAEVYDPKAFPKAQIMPSPAPFSLELAGVSVNPDIRFCLRRTTTTNRLRTGLATIRYAKGKPLGDEVGKWQSSLLYGTCQLMDGDDDKAAEQKLCVTLDALTGRFIEAPGDALSRFKNMEAACQSIAERWSSIEPPPGAVIND